MLISNILLNPSLRDIAEIGTSYHCFSGFSFWKLYSFKNLSFDELKAKVAKALKENGGELVCFDYDLNEKIFEMKVSFPKLEEKVNAE